MQRQSGAWAARAEQYMTQGHVSVIPATQAGAPASTWVLSIGGSPSWTAAAADSDLRQLFPVPGTVGTRAELRAYLNGTTLNQATAGQQANLAALLDSLGVYRADMAGAWTLGRILRRVAATLLEQDPTFGDVWGAA